KSSITFGSTQESHSASVMRVLVYEHLCATGGPDLPASLRVEGWAMLSAALTDFCTCPGVTPVTLVTPDLAPAARALGGVEVHPVESDTAGPLLVTLAAGGFCSLLIAPECGGTLASLCRQVQSAGGRLLGPSPPAVELCADKLAPSHPPARQGVPPPRPVPPPLPPPPPPPGGAGVGGRGGRGGGGGRGRRRPPRRSRSSANRATAPARRLPSWPAAGKTWLPAPAPRPPRAGPGSCSSNPWSRAGPPAWPCSPARPGW